MAETSTSHFALAPTLLSEFDSRAGDTGLRTFRDIFEDRLVGLLSCRWEDIESAAQRRRHQRLRDRRAGWIEVKGSEFGRLGVGEVVGWPEAHAALPTSGKQATEGEVRLSLHTSLVFRVHLSSFHLFHPCARALSTAPCSGWFCEANSHRVVRSRATTGLQTGVQTGGNDW